MKKTTIYIHLKYTFPIYSFTLEYTAYVHGNELTRHSVQHFNDRVFHVTVITSVPVN